MKFLVYGATDLGQRRSINEDTYKFCPKLKLFLVADGMGGHIAGEIASRLAVDIITEYIQTEIDKVKIGEIEHLFPGRLLDRAIQTANSKILETANRRRELEGMGTTIVAVMVNGSTLHLASVGDSRIYRIRNGDGQLLTSDHSWVNMQVRLGNMTAEEARYHPMRNVITRALGTQRRVDVDIRAHRIREGDTVLLCTDGLSNFLEIDEIARMVTKYGTDIETCTEELIRLVNKLGGDDNITALLVHFLAFEQDDIVPSTEDEGDQDTEIIPKEQLQQRFNLKPFPQRPP